MFSVFAKGQESGIRFEENLNWEQIILKAKNESKYIFIDCYTTLCKSCKIMDTNVYNATLVGCFVNHNFISVKVQMDSTEHDNKNVRQWYSIATKFKKEYNVISLPTFLFFSPNGTILHKDIGEKNINEFIKTTSDAQNPDKQLYSYVYKWKAGQLSYVELPVFVKRLMQYYNDATLASAIAVDYIHNYLGKVDDDAFLAKENLLFIGTFINTVGLKDRFLRLCYQHPRRVDFAVGISGYAETQVNYVIAKEFINPMLEDAAKRETEPNWNQLKLEIKQSFNKSIALLNVIDAKKRWYKTKKDRANYIKYLVLEMNLLGLKHQQNAYLLNSNAWNVFLYSFNKQYLKKAICWSDHALEVIREKPQDFVDSVTILDTKANLLYKLGHKRKAIEMEENIAESRKVFKMTLNKMKADLPTWVSGRK
jgi:thioredoxin-related protein